MDKSTGHGTHVAGIIAANDKLFVSIYPSLLSVVDPHTHDRTLQVWLQKSLWVLGESLVAMVLLQMIW